MLQLQINTNLLDQCKLSVEDITGFESVGTPNGFLPESHPTIELDNYKISDGYFFNILSIQSYSSGVKLVGSKPSPINLQTDQVNSTYATNDFNYEINLTKDGRLTYTRMFVISKAYYDANTPTGASIIYYDPVEASLYLVTAGTPAKLTFQEFIETPPTSFTGSLVTYAFLNICNLETLLYKLESMLLANGILTCMKDVDKKLVAARDYVFIALNVIKYLLEENNTSEVARVLDSIGHCCNLFEELLKNRSNDCNCY